MRIVLMFLELVGWILVINIVSVIISVAKVRYFQKKGEENNGHEM